MKKVIDGAFCLAGMAFWIGASLFCGSMAANQCKKAFKGDESNESAE